MSARPISAGVKAEHILLYFLMTVPACWWRVAGEHYADMVRDASAKLQLQALAEQQRGVA